MPTLNFKNWKSDGWKEVYTQMLKVEDFQKQIRVHVT